jgi:hypothetical protein
MFVILFDVMIRTSKLDSKWIPKKEKIIIRENLGTIPKVIALREKKNRT